MTSEGLVIGMASIFGDESADQKSQIVFAVAALVGLESQWEAAAEEWLKITKGREFHANQWETSPHGRDSYNDLVRVISSSGLRGQGVAIDLKEFRAAFPDLQTQDCAYHKCFIETLDRLIKVSADQGYKDLKLTFDGRQGSGTTGLLYDSITAQKEWADAFDFADEISFGNRKNPRIQMADMLARETMRGFLSAIENADPKEPFGILGRSEERIWFDFLVEDYFSQWRSALRELEERTGLCANGYFAWIKRKNMQDNLNSRIRYMIWHDAQALRKKRGES
jgi:hypothetical protein